MTVQYQSFNNKIDSPGRYEVQMLDDKLSPAGTLVDAFGRLRISDAYTLFTATAINEDVDRFSTSITGSANVQLDFHASSRLMNVGNTAGDQVIRESKKVFYYQPGKSLLTMMTFTFNEPQNGLRQRIGYFGANNGLYLEQSNNDISLVVRSYSEGSLQETRVPKSSWNVDTFNGSQLSGHYVPPPSGVDNFYDVRSRGSEALDLTKSQIFWADIEWLGVGDIRCGFVVDGVPRIAHVFHHENRVTKPYMSKANLPIRYEITNTANTSANSTLRQICSTVISEGGFSPDKISPSFVAGRNVNQTYAMPLAGTFYNMVTIRLNPDDNYRDSVVIPEAIDVLGASNARYQWRIVKNGTFGTPLSYTTLSNCPSVQSSNTNSTVSGGRVLDSGFIVTGGSVQLAELNLFEQLERDLDGSRSTYTLAVSPASNQSAAAGLIKFIQVT